MMKCRLCPAPAHFDFGGGHLLCAECVDAMLKRCKLNSQSALEVAIPADSAACPRSIPVVQAAGNLDDFDIPAILKRGADNVAPYARAS